MGREWYSISSNSIDLDKIKGETSACSNNNKNALRMKRHNLNGVYGGKYDYLATGLKNTGNTC